MRSGDRGRRRDRGFTYLGVLALLVLLGLALASAGEVVATAARREREAQLLWVGHAYRAAIGRYWTQRRAYPQSLQELLGSAPDAPVPGRYLRRLYPDPMTNAVDWTLIPAPSGGIMGVASSSTRAPLKAAQFEEVDRDFDKATSYADWQFTFAPPVFKPVTRPKTRAAQPGPAAPGQAPPQHPSTTGPGPAPSPFRSRGR